LEIIAVDGQRNPNFVHVTKALREFGFVFRVRQRGKQHCRENRNDGNDYKQFD